MWHKDAARFISYTAYDVATGAALKTITDVDTTRTSDFTGLPSGWTTPTGGGLHLITTMEVDKLGRTTKQTDPNGNVTYTVYNDATHEVRTYRGWDTSTNTPTGPTEVVRQDRAGGYTERLTMSATPTVVSTLTFNSPTSYHLKPPTHCSTVAGVPPDAVGSARACELS